MGWIEALYNTYNYLEKLEKKREGCAVGLLPPAVIMQKANIEVTIDDKGEFLRAKKIEDKKDSETYIPCTEESASRTSGVAPHALFDQIKYVAGDYEYEFPNEKESNDANKKYFQPYIKALKKWVESEYSDDVIKVIYKYLLGATLARDLVCSNVLDNLKEPNPGKANSNKKEDLEKVCANAYDFVLNGSELGGGSIRIHNADVQKRMFEVLGIGAEEAEYKFGFIINAFKFGAPPHGGLAFGFDRVCALFGGCDSIRDYIAFPKNNQGRDVMIDSPSLIDQSQLDELEIKINKK